ncbi:MAG: hypothetical protein RJA59_2205, partial [Pseudomonadota bacterium]
MPRPTLSRLLAAGGAVALLGCSAPSKEPAPVAVAPAAAPAPPPPAPSGP